VRAGELEEERGTAFAVFDVEALLKEILASRAFGYAIRVDVDGLELYRRVGESEARELNRFAHSEPIAPRVGKPWTLTVVPTTDVLPTSRIESPVVAVAGGFLASALLSAAVHFGTVAWRRAKALGFANEALRRQVDDARRGEDELKRLSAELEARVAQRTGELEETIVELETFNYSASHDLRGPLGAIINFAAILSEDYKNELDATGRDHLARIIRSAGSAVSMMDALLAYSRSRRTELQRVHLDMRHLIEEVAQELVATYPGLPCALKIGDLPPAWADESMMRFVFSNLLSNACKFAKADAAPQVEVGGSATEDETTYFVRDDGIGFDMRFADKLFKVFERLHSPQQYEGQGVGLAIVARMVRRHGGRVWAQGAVGKGATFYVSLPTRNGAEHGRSAT
jgi:signal transduction histidine kinase